MEKTVTFHDYKPQTASLREAVIHGMSRQAKSIPPKFFYDERGSVLFDRICQQPEYYPPIVERRMLSQHAAEIASLTGQQRVLIEPGAGSADKVRLLLDALRPAAFIPMDISCAHLKSAAIALAEEYPWLTVHATCVDFTHSLPIPGIAPDGPRLAFFPGSSIGNFDRSEAQTFLTMVRQAVRDDGMLLIGVDTKKDTAILDKAYNDRAGATAEFNLNLLYRMREELGMECDPAHFEHKAFYNSAAGRIEMHLVSRQKQTLRLNGHRFDIDSGESLHTENSYKYAPAEFLQIATRSGFRTLRHWIDEEGLFAIYLFAAAV